MFLPADGNLFGQYFPIMCAEPTAGTVGQENTYSCIFKVTGKV